MSDPAGMPTSNRPKAPKTSTWSSTWARSTRRRTAFCAWCWRSTAKSSSASIPEIGYLHTGIEKTCEAKFYQQVVPLTDRINYLDPLSNNLCYCAGR
jgi:hypothetical protein